MQRAFELGDAFGVADMVLLNDSFASLPSAFLEGQRIINGMQDIFKLFLTRVVYVTVLIVATGLMAGFPFEPKQNSLLAMLTVGVPTIALAAWARPGARAKGGLVRSLMHFVLPAATTIGLVGVCVYVFYLLISYRVALASTPGLAPAVAAADALASAQTGLMVFCIFCGLSFSFFLLCFYLRIGFHLHTSSWYNWRWQRLPFFTHTHTHMYIYI